MSDKATPPNRNRTNLLVDIAIFTAVMVAMAPHFSGVAIHEWLSIALGAAIITLTVAGRRVELTPSEFDLLATLMLAPGRVFTRSDLLDRVQGTTYEGYGRAIDVHISNLRSKIEANTRHPRYIETVFGIGYCFAAQE